MIQQNENRESIVFDINKSIKIRPYADFKKIKKHFDQLNNYKSHFINSNNICTPMDLVEKIKSIINIKKRIQSYNCGRVEYRINGTNSTTNYFVLQSLLNLNEIFAQTFSDSYTLSKRTENIIILDFIKKFSKKPIGCTQK